MMDGVAVEAPRCLGRIEMMDGVAVEAPRQVPSSARRCDLPTAFQNLFAQENEMELQGPSKV